MFYSPTASADTFAPAAAEPLIFSEVVTKEHYTGNPVLCLPLSKFAEMFPDTTFWRYVNQKQKADPIGKIDPDDYVWSEGAAEAVGE